MEKIYTQVRKVRRVEDFSFNYTLQIEWHDYHTTINSEFYAH